MIQINFTSKYQSGCVILKDGELCDKFISSLADNQKRTPYTNDILKVETKKI